ncbi:MAG TPA: alcohol dehydrogenase catalytic domain-containing protein [Anaeromyxobacteraceae bacterium]|nr:alcohol dehydrogenase catalytic domain-containing protein [Anaeromyxobacteraceae bacterium]
MNETMLAVRNYGPRDYRLETVAKPRARVGEVVVKIDATGICGSDGKCFIGSDMFWAGKSPYVKVPVTPGHEFFGTVVELGEGAAEKWGLALGDKAIAEQIYPCDRCRFCQRGQYWMCEVHDIYGFQREVADGAWAEYMRFGPHARVHKMPKDIRLEDGVLVEPLACAIHAVERGEIQLGDTVVLAGAGTLGLLMLQIIKLKNPGQIIVTDAKPERLEKAKALGAHTVINVKEVDPVAKVKSLTDGYGADVFIEASGYAPAVLQGLDLLRKLGTFVAFGVFGEKTSADWSVIGDRKELNIHGAHLGPFCYPKAIDYLYRGVVSSAPVVTDRLPLREFQKGLDALLAGHGVKIMLDPAA